MIKRRRRARISGIAPKPLPRPAAGDDKKVSSTQRMRDGRPIEPPTPARGPAVIICCSCGYTVTAAQVGSNCPYCAKAGRNWNQK